MHSNEIAAATAPMQVALGTRAGIDMAILTARAALELDPHLVLVSIDGIGAFDHVYRAAMLARLDKLPAARSMLPFGELFYGAPSCYLFEASDGSTRMVYQGEGGEQGDALMPALFALGTDNALKHAATRLEEGEGLIAYLDDVYLLVRRHRAREMYDVVTNALSEQAGIRLNLGKT